MKAFLHIIIPSLEAKDYLICFNHKNLFSSHFFSSLTKSMLPRRDQEINPVLEKFYEFPLLSYVLQLDFYPLVA